MARQHCLLILAAVAVVAGKDHFLTDASCSMLDANDGASLIVFLLLMLFLKLMLM